MKRERETPGRRKEFMKKADGKVNELEMAKQNVTTDIKRSEKEKDKFKEKYRVKIKS